MKRVLIVCSGNSNDDSNFDIKRHQSFIYEQVIMIKNPGVELDFFYVKGKGLTGYLLSWYRLWSHLYKNKYDLIHAHYGLSGFIAVLQPFCRTIITFHGSDINQIKTRLISNLASLMADYRIFVSNKLYKKLYIKPLKNYSVIPCGINLDDFFPIDKVKARKRLNLNENQAYVLFPSYFLNPVKNYPLAKKVMSLIPEAELLELKNKSREEVNFLLNAVDVLLLTSFSEGSSQVIKEAMACNCPIVSTEVGDVLDLFGNMDGCYIATHETADLATKIQMGLDFSKNKRRTLGRKRILEVGLDSETISRRISEVYIKVLSKN